MFSTNNTVVTTAGPEDSDDEDELLKQYVVKKQKEKFEKSKMSKKAQKRYNKKLGIEGSDDEDDEPIFEDEEMDGKKRKRKETDTSSMKFSKVIDSLQDDTDVHTTSGDSLKSSRSIKKALSEKRKHQTKLSHMKHGDKIAKEEKLQSAMTKIVKGRDDSDVKVLQSKLKRQQDMKKKKQKPNSKKRAGFEGKSSGKINDLQNLQKLKQKVR